MLLLFHLRVHTPTVMRWTKHECDDPIRGPPWIPHWL